MVVEPILTAAPKTVHHRFETVPFFLFTTVYEKGLAGLFLTVEVPSPTPRFAFRFRFGLRAVRRTSTAGHEIFNGIKTPRTNKKARS